MNIFDELFYCKQDFERFLTHVKIKDPSKGCIGITLHPYQRDLIKHVEGHDQTVLVKFRQGGFTTIMALYAFWLCMFHENLSILIASKTDRQAGHIKQLVCNAIQWLPPSFQQLIDFLNKDIHSPITCSKIRFGTVDQTRGKSFTHCFIDEAGFIPQMEERWQDLYPSICNAKVVVMSTTPIGWHWFTDLYQDAIKGLNQFSIFATDYRQCPTYDEQHVKELKERLSPIEFAQEIEGCFVIRTE